MPRRHGEDAGIVLAAEIIKIKRMVGDAVRQGLLPLLGTADDIAVMVALLEILDAVPLDRRAVDIERAILHLHLVARQADQALDVVDRGILREAEHHDIAALGRSEEHTSELQSLK